MTLNFETLAVRREASAIFVEILAPPMNLLGPELVRDLVSFIQQAEADEHGAPPADRVLEHAGHRRLAEASDLGSRHDPV